MITLFAALTFSPFDLTNMVSAQEPMTVTVNLTGNEEVPPVQTEATGVAQFTPMGRDSIGYTINATSIEGATAGHIHQGA